MENISPLQIIVGEKLSSVTFVMDYVQLGFDGPLLTAYSGPEVSFGGKVFAWGEPGFRDVLCDRIGAIVRQAEAVDDDAIRISLGDGGLISISLKPEDYDGPEAAELTDISDKAPVIVVF